MVAPHLEKEQEHFVSGLLPRGATCDRIFLRVKQEVILSRASSFSSGGRAELQTHRHQEIGISYFFCAVTAIYAWH